MYDLNIRLKTIMQLENWLCAQHTAAVMALETGRSRNRYCPWARSLL